MRLALAAAALMIGLEPGWTASLKETGTVTSRASKYCDPDFVKAWLAWDHKGTPPSSPVLCQVRKTKTHGPLICGSDGCEPDT